MRVVRVIVRILGWMVLASAALCAVLFYEQYWRWRGCFNELGRCWSSEMQVVFTDDAGLAWGSLTVSLSRCPVCGVRDGEHPASDILAQALPWPGIPPCPDVNYACQDDQRRV